jgi:hypothetical protein
MLGRSGLRGRGWTEALIDRFLPVPDRLAPNPHYRSAAPMKLYLKARVEAIEATDAFRAARARTAPRQAAARKAVQTKRADTERFVRGLEIDVPRLSAAELTTRACRHYNDLKSWRDDWEPASPGSTPEFLDRISVNYLRHQLTPYEEHLEQTFGKVGAAPAYAKIKAKVLAAIAAAYPWLAAEARRQRAALKAETAAREALTKGGNL